MKVIVDTDVWSEAFRKKRGKQSAFVVQLSHLVQDGKVELVGPVRMEVLCGLRDESIFTLFEERLSAFPQRKIGAEIYVLAAKFFNLCRSKGIQGSNTDFLICACAVSWGYQILTKDKDFRLYSKHLPIELIEV